MPPNPVAVGDSEYACEFIQYFLDTPNAGMPVSNQPIEDYERLAELCPERAGAFTAALLERGRASASGVDLIGEDLLDYLASDSLPTPGSGPVAPTEARRAPDAARESAMAAAPNGPPVASGALADPQARASDPYDRFDPADVVDMPPMEIAAQIPTKARSGDRGEEETTGGDPVNLFSGELVHTVTDLSVPTPFLPLDFRRTYRSGRPWKGPLAFNWDHNWNQHVRVLADGRIARWSGDLHEDLFTWAGDRFEPPSGVFELLLRDPNVEGRFVALAPGGLTRSYEAPPGWPDPARIPLVRVEDRFGNFIALEYDDRGRLGRIADGDDRFLTLGYDDCDLLVRLSDHAERLVEYCYDEDNRRLVQVAHPPMAGYPDGVRTSYRYLGDAVHPALRYALTDIIDHHRRFVLENEYGTDPSQPEWNRVVRQRQGPFQYCIAYVPVGMVPPIPEARDIAIWETRLIEPDGALTRHFFNYRGELLEQRLRLRIDRSFREVVTVQRFDEAGNLALRMLPDGSRTEYTWDAGSEDPRRRGLLLRVERRASPLVPVPSRIVFEGAYEDQFQLPTEETGEAGVTRYYYDFDLAPSPDTRGNLLEVHAPPATLPDGTIQESVTHFERDERGQITATVTPAGYRNEDILEPPGSRLAGSLRRRTLDVGGANEWVAWDYDAAGHVSRIETAWTDPVEQDVNAYGLVEEVRLPATETAAVSVTRYRYDQGLHLKSRERPKGSFDGVPTGDWIRDEWHFDGLGLLGEVLLGRNTATPRRWGYARNHRGQPVRESDPQGTRTWRCWDERGLLLSETRAVGTAAELETALVYDRTGRPVRTTMPGGRVHTHAYDAWGRPNVRTNPAGTEFHQEWGALDALLAEWAVGDPGDGGPPRELVRTTYEPDERGRTRRVFRHAFDTDPALAILLEETRWLDPDGRPVALDGPRGQRWSFAWDGLGRPLTSQDPLGNATVTARFLAERRVRTTETHVGAAQSLAIWADAWADGRGRAVRTEDDQGRIATTEYDDRDLPVGTTLPDGTRILRTFGLLGERTGETVDPGGLSLVSSWTHDRMGRVLAFVDPTGERATWLRDPGGRVTRVTLPDGGRYTTIWGPGGEPARTERPSGAVVRLGRDPAGRLSSIVATPGTGQLPVADQTYQYDGLGRIVVASSGGDSVQMRWDSLGRLWREERSGRAFAVARDDLGGVESVTFPDGRVERTDFDLLGRASLASLSTMGGSALGLVGRASDGMLAAVSWLGPNRMAEVQYGHGGRTLRSFDAAGRLLRVEYRDPGDTVLDSVLVLRDTRDRWRVVQREGPAAATALYGYDPKGRLTRADSGLDAPGLPDEPAQADQDAAIAAVEGLQATAQETEQWALDGADTRMSEVTTSPAGSTTAAYVQSAGHRVDQAGPSALAYDADGNRTGDGARSVTFDALGRAREVRDVASGALLAALDYDPLGRIGREVDGAAERWRYHLGPRCLWEEDAGGAPAIVRTILPGLRAPIGEGRTGGAWTWHLGPHDDLLLVAGADGQPGEAYRYSAFGSPEVLDPATGAVRATSAVGQRPLWGGIPWLAAAGFGRTPARLYDPVLGMWLARDPLGYVDSPNLWVFGGQEPMGRIDPSGMGGNEAGEVRPTGTSGGVPSQPQPGGTGARMIGPTRAASPAERRVWGAVHPQNPLATKLKDYAMSDPNPGVPLWASDVAVGGELRRRGTLPYVLSGSDVRAAHLRVDPRLDASGNWAPWVRQALEAAEKQREASASGVPPEDVTFSSSPFVTPAGAFAHGTLGNVLLSIDSADVTVGSDGQVRVDLSARVADIWNLDVRWRDPGVWTAPAVESQDEVRNSIVYLAGHIMPGSAFGVTSVRFGVAFRVPVDELLLAEGRAAETVAGAAPFASIPPDTSVRSMGSAAVHEIRRWVVQSLGASPGAFWP